MLNITIALAFFIGLFLLAFWMTFVSNVDKNTPEPEKLIGPMLVSSTILSALTTIALWVLVIERL